MLSRILRRQRILPMCLFCTETSSLTTKQSFYDFRSKFGSLMAEEQSKSSNKELGREDYEELLRNIGQISQGSEKINRASNELLSEVKQLQHYAFELDHTKKNIAKLSYEDCLYFGLSYFIGSVSSPKNDQVSRYFFEEAESKTTTESEKLEVLFFKAYMERLLAIQTGNEENFQSASDKILELGMNKNAPDIAKHMIAKEMYKVGISMATSSERKNKERVMKEAYALFEISAGVGVIASQYYLGEMNLYGDGVTKVNYKLAHDYFQKAAEGDYPRAYFQLAALAKKGIIIVGKPEIEQEYLRRAAELGLAEAMHNLAVLYLENKDDKDNEFKALAWFVRAGAQGYHQSKLNAARLFAKGTRCGAAKPSKIAAGYLLDSLEQQKIADLSYVRKELEIDN